MSWNQGGGGYIGEPIATLIVDGKEYELRQLTAEERVRSGSERFRVVGESHWNPADFFDRYADELEHRARVHRAAAVALAARAQP